MAVRGPKSQPLHTMGQAEEVGNSESRIFRACPGSGHVREDTLVPRTRIPRSGLRGGCLSPPSPGAHKPPRQRLLPACDREEPQNNKKLQAEVQSAMLPIEWDAMQRDEIDGYVTLVFRVGDTEDQSMETCILRHFVVSLSDCMGSVFPLMTGSLWSWTCSGK